MKVWERFRRGLDRTRERIEAEVGSLLGLREVDPETRQRLEEALLSADVGPATSERLIERAEDRMRREPRIDLREALIRTAGDMLSAKRASFEPDGAARDGKPWVALIVGVNGVGKTTLAGKLAAHFVREHHPTLLVAADT